jgi:hypothetical protein
MIISSIPNRVQILKQKFTNSLGLPFRDLLSESTIREALEAEKISYRRRLFDPFVTLWALLSQVLDTDKSCVNAVMRKRRPKSYPLMKKTRQILHQECLVANAFR